jgi:hypothetical protein
LGSIKLLGKKKKLPQYLPIGWAKSGPKIKISLKFPENENKENEHPILSKLIVKFGGDFRGSL